MSIEDIQDKIKAIGIAQDCVHTINSVRPDAINESVLKSLTELKIDLLDCLDELDTELEY